MLALCSMLSETCYAQNYAGLGLNKTTGIKMHWGITGAYFTCNVILSVGSCIVGTGLCPVG